MNWQPAGNVLVKRFSYEVVEWDCLTRLSDGIAASKLSELQKMVFCIIDDLGDMNAKVA